MMHDLIRYDDEAQYYILLDKLKYFIMAVHNNEDINIVEYDVMRRISYTHRNCRNHYAHIYQYHMYPLKLSVY